MIKAHNTCSEAAMEFSMKYYTMGAKAFQEGMQSHCPDNWRANQRLNWYNGFYDALIEHNIGHILKKYQHLFNAKAKR